MRRRLRRTPPSDQRSRDRTRAGQDRPHGLLRLRSSSVDAPFDLSQTDKLLTTTRAVRKRLDLERDVPRELIRECVGVATQAPAGGNVQRWRWLVVDDPDLKLGLAELYRRAYEPYIAQQRDLVAQAGRSVAG